MKPLTAQRETTAGMTMNERETSQAVAPIADDWGSRSRVQALVLISMNERSSSHIGDQGQMHTFNISKQTWAGSSKIEKRRLWPPAQRDGTAHLPC